MAPSREIAAGMLLPSAAFAESSARAARGSPSLPQRCGLRVEPREVLLPLREIGMVDDELGEDRPAGFGLLYIGGPRPRRAPDKFSGEDIARCD